ncbi:antibiotic biosynthesis monooxygenase [Streptomyces thermolineatus]|uniref:Antibiotic biosynthesis monooxygenase n=1 Tax=Streptomyces thermolineatus TaxID=44033 RepID=A0ABN3MI68_9ACTN
MTEPIVRQPPTAPEIARPDAHAVFVAYWYVEDGEQGRAVLDEIADAWQQAERPEELLSLSCYLSTDDDTVLTYVQCTDRAAYQPFASRLPSASARVVPIEFRLHRSVLLNPQAGPTNALVTALFDVDGAERQRRIVASVAENLERAPADEYTGLIASHFHLSADGTRVINFAEWTSDEAHVVFLDGATRHSSLRITHDMPGVRPIGYRRYHLYRSVGS